MRPETARQSPPNGSIDRLAGTLFDLAGSQEVRVIEALAAVLTRQGARPRTMGLSEPTHQRAFTHLAQDQSRDARLAICQRVARRALRGSLIDPTGGATAVHRVGDVPTWAQDLLPIGMFGPFLFYRLTSEQDGGWRDAQFLTGMPESCWWSGMSSTGTDWLAGRLGPA
ncbi:MAG: hypothetical protein AAF637_09375 [Pseudomonadota bacterium]